MVENQSKLLVSSGVIGIIAIFTPVIFHISPNFFYNFWLWGFTLFIDINSNEIGISYNLEAEFLIPGFIFSIIILASSISILYTTLKANKMQKLMTRCNIIAGIVLIISPLFLMITWQIVYIFIRDYPTFWGVSGQYTYYWPSIAIFLQFLAGTLAILASVRIRVK